MFKKGFTLVLIPGETSRVWRLGVGPIAGAVGGLVLLSFLVLGGLGLYRSVRLESQLREFNALRTKYLRQQVAVKKITNQMDGFRDQVTRLRELDYKLRLITDLEVERPSPSLYGIGGSIDLRNSGSQGEAELGKLDLVGLLDKDLARLKEMANYQEESFNNLKAFLVDRKDMLERSPYRWPVRGFVSSNFGTRLDPFTGLRRQHDGIDIVSPKGTIIQAPADGIVTYTSLDPTLGHMLVIDHGYGVITRYGHNDSTVVREGKRVKRGDPIAYVGTSGKSTGPHLHYEIRINDIAVNPLNYMLE